MMTLDECIAAARLPVLDDPAVNPVAWGLTMAALPISVSYDPENERTPWTIETPTGRVRCSDHLTNVRTQYIYTRIRLSEQQGEKR